jgi:BT1 family
LGSPITIENNQNNEDLITEEFEKSDQNECRNRITILIIALSIGFQVFPNLAMYYFFKDTLQLNLAQVIFYNSILNFIWVLKPVFGFICDSYTLFGSHRKSYLILFSLINVLGWIIMA